MPGPFRSDGQTVELAGKADREVTNVDHFLDLTEALLKNLSGLERHQAAKGLLVPAKLVAEKPDELSAARRRDISPVLKGVLGRGQFGSGGLGCISGHRRDDRSINR